MLPQAIKSPLQEHLKRIKEIHEADVRVGLGEVYLPDALERKYPKAAQRWEWQYVFPSLSLSVDPRSNKKRRHHLSENKLQRAMKNAINQAGIAKAGSCHTLRHSFATHLLENGYDISPREIQQ